MSNTNEAGAAGQAAALPEVSDFSVSIEASSVIRLAIDTPNGKAMCRLSAFGAEHLCQWMTQCIEAGQPVTLHMPSPTVGDYRVPLSMASKMVIGIRQQSSQSGRD